MTDTIELNGFCLISSDELYLIEGGNILRKIGYTMAGCSSGAGLVLALSTNPVGWAIATGAVIGGAIGYLGTL